MSADVDTKLSWLVTGLASAYVAWTGYTLTTRVPAFSSLFAGLGAELPGVTRFAISACRPGVVWPVTIAAITFLVVKELRMPSFRARTLWNIAIFFAAAGIAAVITEALFQPMLQLIQQVG